MNLKFKNQFRKYKIIKDTIVQTDAIVYKVSTYYNDVVSGAKPEVLLKAGTEVYGDEFNKAGVEKILIENPYYGDGSPAGISETLEINLSDAEKVKPIKLIIGAVVIVVLAIAGVMKFSKK